jgi:hypothetical protein
VLLQLVWLREHDSKALLRDSEAASNDALLTELQQELRRQELLAETRDADLADVCSCNFFPASVSAQKEWRVVAFIVSHYWLPSADLASPAISPVICPTAECRSSSNY